MNRNRAFDLISVRAHPAGDFCVCPDCGQPSNRVHSRYERQLLDLPSHGRAVQIRVAVRRFRCISSTCLRRIFVERLAHDVAHKSGRRTCRLEGIIHHLGIALGGRPAASLAKRLMLPVSKDTLLRVVRRRAIDHTEPLRVIGIDDWAWKRGQRYGTIICDLERRRIVELLPDREPATVAAWLSRQPEVAVIARDRAGGYAQAATRCAPQAIQVADRWHLMENGSAAFLKAVRCSMRSIRQALGSAVVDPAQLTSAERRQHETYGRREQAHDEIRELARLGTPIKEIVRRTGRSRKLVREIIRGGGGDVFRCRTNSLEPHLGWLENEWAGGCRNGAELWRRLRAAGFKGGLRVVTEWATRRRRSESASNEMTRKVPPARMIARLMMTVRDHLSKADAIIVTATEAAAPLLTAACDLTTRFHEMLRRRDPADLQSWIDDASTSLLSSFATGIISDRKAVTASLQEPWSNGQTEGQITKLKLVKRQMYGRAKLDLLRARLIVPV